MLFPKSLIFNFSRNLDKKAGQNAEKPGTPGQAFSEPPLNDLVEALELLSEED